MVALVNQALLHRIELPSAHGNEMPLRKGAIWTASIAAERMDGGVSYHADIFENGIFVCRLALSSCIKREAAAEIELNRRLHLWIAEYEQRSAKSDWN
jgi:hypothetical protein